MRWLPVGDRAVTAYFDAFAPGAAEGARAVEGVRDVIAAFNTLTVVYDPLSIRSLADLALRVDAAIESAGTDRPRERRRHEIPVCYDQEFAPDLQIVAANARLTPAEVISLHLGAEYAVTAIGFMPGFAYLSGLPPALHMERLKTPRTRVPAGAVGIGSSYTGVYPRESPGGWRIIGRSPMTMFDPSNANAPAVLRVGDVVRFRSISREAYERWK